MVIFGLFTVFVAACLSAALIVLLRPALQRYALARPNARSSHTTPTPQGGGIAVVVAAIAVAGFAMVQLGSGLGQLLPVFGAALIIAVVGGIDDILTIPITPRLVLQTAAVAIGFMALPDDLRLLPFLPWWLEYGLLLIGCVWFTNLVNFMDGIDWMTVAEVIPLTAGLVLLGMLGALPSYGIVLALALGGAMIGFAPFNRPVAKLFLGDVGSLPVGLLIAWLLLLLAARGYLVAALLLPLYYLADTTITLGRRFLEGEKVWHAHRTHFYQRATDAGFAVWDILARVFIVNLCLIALATVTVWRPALAVNLAALAIGGGLVAWLLLSFARGKS